MPTKQISAVDWLANELDIPKELLKLAKAIEKHQILEAYHVGYSRGN